MAEKLSNQRAEPQTLLVTLRLSQSTQLPSSLSAQGSNPASARSASETLGASSGKSSNSLALTAAEMGSLVFGTLHTNSAAKTVDRVVDAFPADEQAQARLSLSESLAGVVSQLLLRSADGRGRCAANEILLRSSGLANVIREGNTPLLQSLMQSGRSQGMRTMDDSLAELVRSGRVDRDEGYRRAHDKDRFDRKVNA